MKGWRSVDMMLGVLEATGLKGAGGHGPVAVSLAASAGRRAAGLVSTSSTTSDLDPYPSLPTKGTMKHPASYTCHL